MLVIQDVSKVFGKRVVLDHLTFSLQAGEILGVVGESGVGKTTLLSIIAGFVSPDKGQVSLKGADITNIPPYNRGVGLVLQEYSLFPHMTVLQNLIFGLPAKDRKSKEVIERLHQLTQTYGIYELLYRKPGTLSGGEKQRVALLRALIRQPEIILLDEPFGNLDTKLKWEILPEIRKLLRQRSQTAIYVSHDQTECFFVSDRMAILHGGMFEQVGTPYDVYEQPATEYVAKFIGGHNIFAGEVTKLNDGNVIRFCEAAIDCPQGLKTSHSKVAVIIRPEYIYAEPDNKRIYLGKGKLAESIYIGGRFLIRADISTGETVYYHNNRPIEEGTMVSIFCKPEKIVCIPRKEDLC